MNPLVEVAPKSSHGYAQPEYQDIPLTQQPGVVVKYPEVAGYENCGGAPVPYGVPMCPPGLEYLTMVDQLLVHQKVEMLEILCGCETQNKYEIKNNMGQAVYTAKEKSDCCCRLWVTYLRPFDMMIKDHTGKEVIHLYRKFSCQGCCCPCCLQEIEVFSPPGNLIGKVFERWSICRPKYSVEDAHGNQLFKITGPIIKVSCCCNDVDFPVLSPGGEEIGKITKQYSGFCREMVTDADHFGITFPMDLDVNMKAVLLGALFLIDFNYFESQSDVNGGSIISSFL